MADKNFVIGKNGRFREKESGRTVVVFFVENVRGEVRYSFEGRGSGREFVTDFDTFHRDFEPVEPGETNDEQDAERAMVKASRAQAATAEKTVAKREAEKQKENEVTEEKGVVSRTLDRVRGR